MTGTPSQPPGGDVGTAPGKPSTRSDELPSPLVPADTGHGPPASVAAHAPAWRLPPAILRATLFLVTVGALSMLFTAAPWRSSTSAPQTFEQDGQSDQPLRTGYRINLNVATAGELRLLPGVGPIMAERIVEHREAHGLFSSVDELDAVHGVGPRTLERLKPYVTIEPEPGRTRP